MESIQAYLTDKQLSKRTIEQYNRVLLILNDRKIYKNLQFLSDIKKILDKLEKYKLNTKRSYIVIIMSILKSDVRYKQLYNDYFDIYEIINKKIKLV